MKPRRVKGSFNRELFDKCRQFAKDSLPTSVDQYTKRGQDPTKLHRQIIQLTNGKLGEELAYATYVHYYPELSLPDYEIYKKKDKSWTPDLTDAAFGIKIAVKTKDARDAASWGMSVIFEKTDKKIFGDKLDNQNLDPNQYVCMVVVDLTNLKGEVKACVNLQWLHDKNLFEKPDRDYLGTKLTVRFDSIIKVISDQNELWQLKCEEK
jgi:hypothetical protein